MLVAADVYRPAAIDQLNILGKKVIFVSLLDFLEYIELTINACSILFGSSNYTCLNVLVYLYILFFSRKHLNYDRLVYQFTQRELMLSLLK